MVYPAPPRPSAQANLQRIAERDFWVRQFVETARQHDGPLRGYICRCDGWVPWGAYHACFAGPGSAVALIELSVRSVGNGEGRG